MNRYKKIVGIMLIVLILALAAAPVSADPADPGEKIRYGDLDAYGEANTPDRLTMAQGDSQLVPVKVDCIAPEGADELREALEGVYYLGGSGAQADSGLQIGIYELGNPSYKLVESVEGAIAESACCHWLTEGVPPRGDEGCVPLTITGIELPCGKIKLWGSGSVECLASGGAAGGSASGTLHGMFVPNPELVVIECDQGWDDPDCKCKQAVRTRVPADPILFDLLVTPL